MRIATWNINGVKARLETAIDWLSAARPAKPVKDAFEVVPFAEQLAALSSS